MEGILRGCVVELACSRAVVRIAAGLSCCCCRDNNDDDDDDDDDEDGIEEG